MKHNDSKPTFGIIFLALIIIASVMILVTTIIVPKLVSNTFGNPSSQLSISQRILLPLKLYFSKDDLLKPSGLVIQEVPFEINVNESASSVCNRLELSGLIKNSDLFCNYLIYKGFDTLIQSGAFRLSSALTALEIADLLTEPIKKEVNFVILPGWRIEEIAASLVTSGLSIEPEEFISLAYHPTNILTDQVGLDPDTSLEGFLYPTEYQVLRNIELFDFLSLLLDEFNKHVDSNLIGTLDSQGLTLHEAVTMASIIQREAIIEHEQPMIASVFYNRLKLGMRLETDPSVQYALASKSLTMQWWKSPLYFEDLTVESPYNTYQIYGLPPGPICNPSISAIMAVAFPDESPYYYFRGACDDSRTHSFSITYSEHLDNECP